MAAASFFYICNVTLTAIVTDVASPIAAIFLSAAGLALPECETRAGPWHGATVYMHRQVIQLVAATPQQSQSPILPAYRTKLSVMARLVWF